MRIERRHLSVLFNRLYDRGDERFAIEHPADEVGELLEVELGPYDDCTLRFRTDAEAYATARDEVRRTYPERVAADLPDPDDYVTAVLASGAIGIDNVEEVTQLLERYGDPDLTAGHPPVFAGFDTNLLPWRIDQVLGLRERGAGIGYVNGFVLATGVRDELDWDYKCHDTDPFVDAFGSAFEEYWNQPVGDARIGRLGMQAYRDVRDVEQAVEIQSEEGDEQIVAAYDAYDDEHRGQILLFSNDRAFVERARAHTLLGQWIDLPDELPRSTSATWRQVETLVYVLTVLFGVLELPAVTLHGVWRGKEGLDWQRERLEVRPRSPPLESDLAADLSIVESHDELTLR